jgi:hypothetical protein
MRALSLAGSTDSASTEIPKTESRDEFSEKLAQLQSGHNCIATRDGFGVICSRARQSCLNDQLALLSWILG